MRLGLGKTRSGEGDQRVPILSIELSGRGFAINTRGDCFVDSSEQMYSSLNKDSTPNTLKTNHLGVMTIIRGGKLRKYWQNWKRDRVFVACSVVSQRPQEPEKLRAQLTKGICRQGSKSETLLMVFRKIEFIFVLLNGLQSVTFENRDSELVYV